MNFKNQKLNFWKQLFLKLKNGAAASDQIAVARRNLDVI
jgi:hypothetical protein